MFRKPPEATNLWMHVERILGVYDDKQFDKVSVKLFFTIATSLAVVASAIVYWGDVRIGSDTAAHVLLLVAGFCSSLGALGMVFLRRCAVATSLLILALLAGGACAVAARYHGYSLAGLLLASITLLLGILNTETYSNARWTRFYDERRDGSGYVLTIWICTTLSIVAILLYLLKH